MRAVAGAVKNALDAHPGWRAPKWLANSVAKRAAGTLTAGWPDVLAAQITPSENGRVGGFLPTRPSQLRGPATKTRGGGVSSCKGHLPRALLVTALARPLRQMKKTDPVRAEVYVEVLKLIDKLAKGER